MNERAAAAAATAAAGQQRSAQIDAMRAAEAQANYQKALDAMARLRDTIDRRPGRIFPEAQKT